MTLVVVPAVIVSGCGNGEFEAPACVATRLIEKLHGPLGHGVPFVSRLPPTIWKLAASVPESVQHEPENAGSVGDITGVPMAPTTVPEPDPGVKVLFESGTDAMVCAFAVIVSACGKGLFEMPPWVATRLI